MILVSVWMANTVVHWDQFIPDCITTVAVVWLVHSNATKCKTNKPIIATLCDTFSLSQQNRCSWQTKTVVNFGNQSTLISRLKVLSKNEISFNFQLDSWCKSPCIVIGNTIEIELMSYNTVIGGNCRSRHSTLQVSLLTSSEGPVIGMTTFVVIVIGISIHFPVVSTSISVVGSWVLSNGTLLAAKMGNFGCG